MASVGAQEPRCGPLRMIGAVLSAVALLWLTPSPALADGRNLILTDKSRQAVGDIDFAQPPVWKTPVECDVRDVHDGCRLARMTAEPTGTAPAEIVATALRVAQRIDASRDQSPDGYATLRASEAYLVAAAYEMQIGRMEDAREHFKLALSRAGDVPRSVMLFQPTYTVVKGFPQKNPLAVSATMPGVATSNEEADRYYPQAQLVREYASRALASFTDH